MLSVWFPLTRDFVLQFHVGYFAPSRHAHAPGPVGSIQLPIGSPAWHTQAVSVMWLQMCWDWCWQWKITGERQGNYCVPLSLCPLIFGVSKASGRHFTETFGWNVPSTPLLTVVSGQPAVCLLGLRLSLLFGASGQDKRPSKDKLGNKINKSLSAFFINSLTKV